MANYLNRTRYCGLLLWLSVLACGDLQQLGPNTSGAWDSFTSEQQEQESAEPGEGSANGEVDESDSTDSTGNEDTDGVGESGKVEDGEEGDDGDSGTDTSTVPQDDPQIEFDFECLKIDRVFGPRIVRPAGLRINFRVTDCDGDPAPPLGQSDFQIINDEKGQPFGQGLEGGGFSQLGVPSSYALYSVLALDMSESIFRTDSVDDVVSAALNYLEHIDESNPAGAAHEVALVAFGRPEAFEVLQDFTLDREQLRRTIGQLVEGSSRGSTDLYGTYNKGLAMLNDRGLQFELSEKFFVLLSDGTHEAGNEEELRSQALEARNASDVNIYSIGIEGNYDSDRLKELATAPSNFLHVSDTDELSRAFRRVAKRVEAIANSNYSVGVCTPVALGEPSLTIRVGMSRQDGEFAQAEVTLPYSVAALDGDVGACTPAEITDGKLSCHAAEDDDGDGQNDEVCEAICQQMQCGCDMGVSCGSCGGEEVCSRDFQCVEAISSNQGDTNGDKSCESNSTGSAPEGLELQEVRASQGVAIPLWRDGASIALEQRTAPIIPGRQMMLQAAWKIDESWVQRSIRADLILSGSEGIVDILSDTVQVDAASVLDDFEQSFSWSLKIDQVHEDFQYGIKLYEVDSSFRTRTSMAEFVEQDSGIEFELGVATGRHQIDLVLVPITHQLGNCSKTPTGMKEIGERYAGFLLATYPVRAVNIQTRSTPIPYEGALNGDGWIELLGSLSQLRSQDGALDHQFYHGVIDPCESTNGIAGIGYVPPNPSLRAMAPYRTSLGLVSDWTLAHELGHNMGRKHVACSGQEANPDGHFPYAGGKIGVWGLDLREGLPSSDSEANQMRVSPMHHDFMSYCGDKWMSDYGWKFSHDTIADMESWSAVEENRRIENQSSTFTELTMLMGIVRENGSSHWWTEVERRPAGVATTDLENGPKIHFFSQETLMHEVNALYVPLSDDHSISVRAVLPSQTPSLTHFSYNPASSWTVTYARTSRPTIPQSSFRVSMDAVKQ